MGTHVVYRRPIESFPIERTARDRLKWDFRYRRRRWYNYYRPLDNIVFDTRGVVFGRWRYGELPVAHYPGDDLPDEAS